MTESQFEMKKLFQLLGKASSFLFIALIGFIGERGDDGGFIKEVWVAAKTASPFAAMFAILVWLDERRERREAQKQCNDRTVDFITSMNESISTFERMMKNKRILAKRRQQ